MSEPRETPRLVAVDGAGAPGAAGDGSARAAESGRPGSGLVWVLAVALAVCAILLASQLQRASALREQVTSLRSELTAAHENLARYEAHLGVVRGHVADLSGRMAALEALVARDPTLEPDADAPVPEPSPGP